MRFRNRFAHGGLAPPANPVWSLWEHLLLSSYIYPLLLKLFVSDFDPTITFRISGDDVKKIRMLERVLGQQNYYAETAPDSGTTNWGHLISEARWLV